MPAFTFTRPGGALAPAEFDTLIVTGWTGRDTRALEHHVESAIVRPIAPDASGYFPGLTPRAWPMAFAA